MTPPDLLTTTYPQDAWLSTSVLAAMTAAAILLTTLIARGWLLSIAGTVIRTYARQRQRARLGADVRPTLLYTPALLPPSQLTAVAIGALIVIGAGAQLVTATFIALVLSVPLMIVAVIGALALAESRYEAKLDADLVDALGRLTPRLAQSGFRTSLQQIIATMDAGPLADEWRWMVANLDRPIMTASGANQPATAADVAFALSMQTPSARHSDLLTHLTTALRNPEQLVVRMEAAYNALQASNRRRSYMVTRLNRMRGQGNFIVGIAGCFVLYLCLTMQTYVIPAFTIPVIGTIAAVVEITILLQPMLVGAYITRTDDIVY